MDIIEEEFREVGIMRHRIILYHLLDAVKVIERCRDLKIKILGIDAFFIYGEKIQPCMEKSIDFSILNKSRVFRRKSGYWDEAVQFMKDKDDTMLFEVVYQGYSAQKNEI